MGMLGGLGEGLQKFSQILWEHDKMNKEERSRQLQDERQMHLESLRQKHAMALQKGNQEFTSAENEKTRAAQEAQFGKTFGLQEQQLGAQVEQNERTYGLQERQQATQADQFGQTLGLQKEQLAAQRAQNERTYGLQQEQLGLQREQFHATVEANAEAKKDRELTTIVGYTPKGVPVNLGEFKGMTPEQREPLLTPQMYALHINEEVAKQNRRLTLEERQSDLAQMEESGVLDSVEDPSVKEIMKLSVLNPKLGEVALAVYTLNNKKAKEIPPEQLRLAYKDGQEAASMLDPESPEFMDVAKKASDYYGRQATEAEVKDYFAAEYVQKSFTGGATTGMLRGSTEAPAEDADPGFVQFRGDYASAAQAVIQGKATESSFEKRYGPDAALRLKGEIKNQKDKKQPAQSGQTVLSKIGEFGARNVDPGNFRYRVNKYMKDNPTATRLTAEGVVGRQMDQERGKP
jgi:hypothetical protein